MRVKERKKIIVDVAMISLLLPVMAYQITGNFLHEWMGVILFFFFTIHHIFNWNWYRAILKGRYTAARNILTVIGLLLILSVLGLMISGVMISHSLFGFLNLGADDIWLKIHIASAAWGYVLMSVHIGLHIGRIRQILKKAVSKTILNKLIYVYRFAVIILSVYGVGAFLFRKVGLKMAFLMEYSIYAYDEPKILLFLDYLSIMILFVNVSCVCMKRVKA